MCITAEPVRLWCDSATSSAATLTLRPKRFLLHYQRDSSRTGKQKACKSPLAVNACFGNDRMSNAVRKLVENRNLGTKSGTRKCILLSMADRASDDGTGIWCSKSTLADITGFCKTAVKAACRKLKEDGLIIEVGRKPCSHGSTSDYSIDLLALENLPLTTAGERALRRVDLRTGSAKIHEKGGVKRPSGGRETPPNHPRTTRSLLRKSETLEVKSSASEHEHLKGDPIFEKFLMDQLAKSDVR